MQSLELPGNFFFLNWDTYTAIYGSHIGYQINTYKGEDVTDV